MTPEKAEIIGLLCAEGSYYNSFSTFWEYYPGRGKYYLKKKKRTSYIQFANYNNKLLLHFKYLIKKIYNHDVSITKDRIRICKREIIQDLLKYTDYGHIKWSVPIEIQNGIDEVKIRFIRGFFDGDGTVSTTIRLFSTNKDSLKDVSNLLNNLGINHTFNGPCSREGRKPYFYIYICKNEEHNFLKTIAPVSKCR